MPQKLIKFVPLPAYLLIRDPDVRREILKLIRISCDCGSSGGTTVQTIQFKVGVDPEPTPGSDSYIDMPITKAADTIEVFLNGEGYLIEDLDYEINGNDLILLGGRVFNENEVWTISIYS